MAKKQPALSARDTHQKGSAKHISDREIDFSDIPESTPDELRRAVRVGRPATGQAKQMIAVRIAPTLLAKIRKMAAKREIPYQTLLHNLLEEAVAKAQVKTT